MKHLGITDDGRVIEFKYRGYLELEGENERLRALLRESLKVTGDGAWHRRVHEALGEPLPPTRKLKGRTPEYQKRLIAEGKLRD